MKTTEDEKVKEAIKKKLSNLDNCKLYKYRECNDNNFDALKNQYVWLPLASEMPDSFDCALNYDPNKDIEDIQKWFMDNGLEWSFYHQILLNAEKQNDDFAFNSIDLHNAFNNLKSSFGKLDFTKLPTELTRFICLDSVKKVYNHLSYINSNIKSKTDMFDPIINYYKQEAIEANQYGRTKIAILCLAESYQINSMWEMYAENKTGFCIEYDFRKLLNKIDDNMWLSSLTPMWYRSKPHVSLLEVFNTLLENCLLPPIKNGYYDVATSDANMQLVMKDPSYSYEKEWRVILGGNCLPRKLKFDFASAIYVGENISCDNYIAIDNICKKLNIPIYKQERNLFGSKYDYIITKRV